jgi:hypothetical protein
MRRASVTASSSAGRSGSMPKPIALSASVACSATSRPFAVISASVVRRSVGCGVRVT